MTMSKLENWRQWRDKDPEHAREISRRANKKHYHKNLQLSRRKSREYQAEQRRRDPARAFYDGLKSNAKSKGADFQLSLGQVADLLKPMRCSASGLELEWSPTSELSPWHPSMDRLDSSKGYAPGNVRVVCVMFNGMRNRWRDKDCLKLARALVKSRA